MDKSIGFKVKKAAALTITVIHIGLIICLVGITFTQPDLSDKMNDFQRLIKDTFSIDLATQRYYLIIPLLSLVKILFLVLVFVAALTENIRFNEAYTFSLMCAAIGAALFLYWNLLPPDQGSLIVIYCLLLFCFWLNFTISLHRLMRVKQAKDQIEKIKNLRKNLQLHLPKRLEINAGRFGLKRPPLYSNDEDLVSTVFH